MGKVIEIKKRQGLKSLMEDLISDVNMYWTQFGDPAPWSSVSRRYARIASTYDTSIRNIIAVLSDTGDPDRALHIQMEETMRRLIWPIEAWNASGYASQPPPEPKVAPKVDGSTKDPPQSS